jgi:TonB family protein
MSVEASEFISEAWTRWQGHVINGVYPLGRCLGCSDHSGVFLTKSATGRSDLAVKLVPTDRALAEALLPRWKRAGKLTHPHLLRLLEWGGCQLDGLPYLYTVMEYADQTLAQLLLHRALTDEEAQEMLVPVLDALAFLHERNLMQGQLKPANILVVGDQLKLASDTIRRVTEGMTSANTPTIYDSPNAQRGNSSTTDDIRALGVSLFEALTRRPPASLGEGETVTLPADFSPKFRAVLTRCLSPRPLDRPTASELIAWTRGRSADRADRAVAATPPVAPEAPQPRPPAPLPPPAQTAPAEVTPIIAAPAPSRGPSPKARSFLTVMLGVLVALASAWIGWRLLRPHRTPIAPPSAVQAPASSSSSSASGAAPTAAQAPVAAVPTTTPASSDATGSPRALHQVIPEVPAGVRRGVRGHIQVWVRVSVDQGGSVSGAVVDRNARSSYFRRLAVEAAKQWTFSPGATASPRQVQLRFDFSRNGTTARAAAVH